ncbi:uncharacterized protein [Triticum aestivum]|uniref:uncharacterized protein n=1 Tax=Triticum aestivum TaxID=4565 RepID=UPI001D02193B|nr:uncharacterized protein LOC123059322 [Triticum aestivum]XP_044337852.1 uncharacterized protein LOC123059322 [Triticum aestivum]
MEICMQAITSRGRSYDFFIEDEDVKSHIYGAYWKAFVRAHQIEFGDVVCFEAVAWGNQYNVTVFDEEGNEKIDNHSPGIMLVPNDVRVIFQDISFTDLRSLTDDAIGGLVGTLSNDVGLDMTLLMRQLVRLSGIVSCTR